MDVFDSLLIHPMIFDFGRQRLFHSLFGASLQKVAPSSLSQKGPSVLAMARKWLCT
jgi:hypothetical protein